LVSKRYQSSIILYTSHFFIPQKKVGTQPVQTIFFGRKFGVIIQQLTGQMNGYAIDVTGGLRKIMVNCDNDNDRNEKGKN